MIITVVYNFDFVAMLMTFGFVFIVVFVDRFVFANLGMVLPLVFFSIYLHIKTVEEGRAESLWV